MIRLTGNDSIWLDEPGPSYELHAGSIAIFAVEREAGFRRYLFTVEAGETVHRHFAPPGTRWRLVAIPLTDCLLSSGIFESGRWYESLFRSTGMPEIPPGHELTPLLHRALDDLELRRQDEQRARFEARRKLNEGASASALSHLLDAFRERPQASETPSGSALFLAARAVANQLGIRLRSTSDDDAPQDLRRDRIAALAHRSGIRFRRVILAGRWWERENGPLLAFLHDPLRPEMLHFERNTPVALLPLPRSHWRKPQYVLYEPAQNLTLPVDTDLASLLNPVAVMFYRPLPENGTAASLLRLALASRSKDISTIVACGVAALLLGMVAPQATNVLINLAIPDGDRNLVWQVALAMLAAATGAMLLLVTQSVATLRAQTAAFNTLQPAVWDYLLKLSPAFFRSVSPAELRLRADGITRIHQLFTADAMRVLLGGAASLFILILLLYYSVPLGLLAVLAGAVIVGSTFLGVRHLMSLYDANQQMEGDLSGLVLQLINSVSKLRVAGATRRAFALWAADYSRKQRHSLGIQTIKDRLRLISGTVPTVVIAISFLYLLGQDGTTRLPLGTFLAFNAALGIFLAGISAGADAVAGLAVAGSIWRRTEAILRVPAEVDSSKVDPGRLKGDIAIEHVTFRYRADGPLTLDGVSIRAAAGECIALTGPSGSGKSTLINLLLRFEVPSSGAIYFDGYDVASLDIASVRRQIGVVTQDSKIMSQSIYENITSGGVSSMDDAWEAARMAGFAGEIEQMPMGMHTVISEGGGNISGGQRQRLLIARALVLKPSILIFDEATSALDNRTQAIVTESLRKLNATRILVAHRLTTIREADRIYVIEAGRVTQCGTYPELASDPGLFGRLMERQAVT